MGLITMLSDLVRLPARKLRGAPGLGWVKLGDESPQTADEIQYVMRDRPRGADNAVTKTIIPRFSSIFGTAFVWAAQGAWILALLIVAEVVLSPITRQL